jgi:flagellar motor switch protein FliG
LERGTQPRRPGFALVSEAGSTFQEIVGVVKRPHSIICEIATASSEQSTGIQQVGDASSQTDAVSQQNTALVVINSLSNQHEEAAIDSVRDYNDDLAQQIVDEMFTFEKLVALDDRSIRLLLREIDSQTLVVALKVGPPELRDRLTANMSQRAAELFIEDIQASAPVRLSEVELQQRSILQIARKLADSGEITLGDKAGDADV